MLPGEIKQIIQTLTMTYDPETLRTAKDLRLLLVCKQFHNILKPLLYEDLTLDLTRKKSCEISRLQHILRSNGTLLRQCPQALRLCNDDLRLRSLLFVFQRLACESDLCRHDDMAFFSRF